MTAMDDREMRKEARARRKKFATALATIILGGLIAGVGFAIGLYRTGEEATVWGVAAGLGVGLAMGGLFMAWIMRPGANGWRPETEPLKRDRLQTQRARQLWVFPMVAILMLTLAAWSTEDILSGRGELSDFLMIGLPVLYAWLILAVTMGWDGQSRKNRRFLEDELTQVLRARAMIAGFVVLMAGATVALGLGAWRPEVGVAALPFALTAGAVAAGIRFAWLDREFGKDG